MNEAAQKYILVTVPLMHAYQARNEQPPCAGATTKVLCGRVTVTVTVMKQHHEVLPSLLSDSGKGYTESTSPELLASTDCGVCTKVAMLHPHTNLPSMTALFRLVRSVSPFLSFRRQRRHGAAWGSGLVLLQSLCSQAYCQRVSKCLTG